MDADDISLNENGQPATGCDRRRGDQPALTISSLGALPMMVQIIECRALGIVTNVFVRKITRYMYISFSVQPNT